MGNQRSNDSRRKLLKSIAAGSGAVVAGKSLPESWSKPVLESVILPAHAELTDGGSSGTIPEPLNYFDTNLTKENQQRFVKDEINKQHLFVDVIDALIPVAHADIPPDIGGMSVIVEGSSATVRFLGSQRSSIHNVMAPIDGTASGSPVLEAGACPAPRKGPQSVQLIGYTSGDSDVRVRVNGGNGRWEVVVPMDAIGSLAVSCAASDIRLKTNIEALSTSREGFDLYKFQYLSDADKETYVGVMAQDIMTEYPEAIVQNESGFLMVRYDRIGLKMVTLEDWESYGPGSVELKH